MQTFAVVQSFAEEGGMNRQRAARGVRVANAPLSYGAFEMTVGTAFPVPDPAQVLAAIGDAGYSGTDLGPPGYLGEGQALAGRLESNELELVGGFVPIRF